MMGSGASPSVPGPTLLRIVESVTSHPAFGIGGVLALIPFLIQNLRVQLGLAPVAQSLPIWIRAPWDIGPNLRDGAQALGPLVGCDPGAPASVLIGTAVLAIGMLCLVVRRMVIG